MIDLYEVLQVDRCAESEVIRAAYRALARKYHPDFGGSARLMASINEAWAILGNPDRRAAYDAEPRALDDRPGARSSPPVAAARASSSRPLSFEAARGLAGHRRVPHTTGTVLDFGRYAGWTIGSLADQDPDYLEWLARTPVGRHLAHEIDAALARRGAEAAARTATRPQPRRRAFI